MNKLIILNLIFLVLFSGCNTSQDEIIIVPKDYIGYVIIVYDQENGVDENIKDGKRLMLIPKEGILQTKCSLNSDWGGFPMFYYENANESNRIPFNIEYENIPINSISAYGGTSATVNKDLKGNSVLRYVQYYIGNKSQIDSIYNVVEGMDITEIIK
ncbi:MAG: hypothetical protein KDD41_09245 [Flavobacteriales bacterium]|nr:hypothetical protein [Flavobacteriales bacterium]